MLPALASPSASRRGNACPLSAMMVRSFEISFSLMKGVTMTNLSLERQKIIARAILRSGIGGGSSFSAEDRKEIAKEWALAVDKALARQRTADAKRITELEDEIVRLQDLENMISCGEADVTLKLIRELFGLRDFSSTREARAALRNRQ